MMSSAILLAVDIPFIRTFAWTPTLAAVFLVAVVHAVEDLVAAPTPRDAVGSVQTQELVLPALLHAADLAGQEAADVRASRPFSALFEWIIGCWRSGGKPR